MPKKKKKDIWIKSIKKKRGVFQHVNFHDRHHIVGGDILRVEITAPMGEEGVPVKVPDLAIVRSFIRDGVIEIFPNGEKAKKLYKAYRNKIDKENKAIKKEMLEKIQLEHDAREAADKAYNEVIERERNVI